MPVYAKKVSTNDRRFAGRSVQMFGVGSYEAIPVPDSIVVCNGCNKNLAETEEQTGYLVYLGKREMAKDQPYDIYCEQCLNRYFPGAIK